MPAHYLLQGHQWTWAFTEEVGDNAKYFFYGYKTADGWEKWGGRPDGYTTVPGILGAESDAEALRLAVLAVAGVQG
jgi:hypothetical protein